MIEAVPRLDERGFLIRLPGRWKVWQEMCVTCRDVDTFLWRLITSRQSKFLYQPPSSSTPSPSSTQYITDHPFLGIFQLNASTAHFAIHRSFSSIATVFPKLATSFDWLYQVTPSQNGPHTTFDIVTISCLIWNFAISLSSRKHALLPS